MVALRFLDVAKEDVASTTVSEVADGLDANKSAVFLAEERVTLDDMGS